MYDPIAIVSDEVTVGEAAFVAVVDSSSSSNPIRAQEEIIRLGTTSAIKNFPNNYGLCVDDQRELDTNFPEGAPKL